MDGPCLVMHPHAASLALLQRSGVATTPRWCSPPRACSTWRWDRQPGLRESARKWLWWAQCALLAGSTLNTAVTLPEYQFHPLGEISKRSARICACWPAWRSWPRPTPNKKPPLPVASRVRTAKCNNDQRRVSPATSSARSFGASLSSTPLTYLCPSMPPKDLVNSTASLMTTR